MPTQSSHWGRRSTPWPTTAQGYTRTLTESIGLSDFMQSVVTTVGPGPGELPVTVATGADPVANGTNLQQAINVAAIGSTIVVKSGATYQTTSTNGFTFPPKGTGWDNRRVTLCCSRIGDLPAGTRAGSAQTGLFATLVTGVKGPTLSFSGARGWTLQGLEVSYTAACQTGASVQQLVDMANADADLTLERCWIHPRESVTAPTSTFRAVNDGINNLATVKNFQLLDGTVEGLTGRGYDNVLNAWHAIYSQGGTHLRVKNNFIQGLRGWYLEHGQPDDVVIQRNQFDIPVLWDTWGLSGDYRHLIFYVGTNVRIVGNTFTGNARREAIGIFFDQALSNQVCRRLYFLSNFLDSLVSGLAQIVLYHAPDPGSDIVFMNNLARGGQLPASDGGGSAWAGEFGGPAGTGIGVGTGIKILHNTVRGTVSFLFASNVQNHPSEWMDVRYNISYPGNYWFSTNNVAADYPNLRVESNRFIGTGATGRPSFVSADQIYVSDADTGMANAGNADAGGPITGYALSTKTAQADMGQDHGCNIPALQTALTGGLDWDPPELPRVYMDTTYALPTGGQTRNCLSGQNLQTYLDAAQPGDVITVAAGATFTGAFHLRAKGASTAWIYIVSSAYGSLPPPGTRVGPAHAANMPTIQTADFQEVIWADPGAHHYRFVGCHITTTHNPGGGNSHDTLVQTFGDGTLASMAHHLVFDRCYIHGEPTYGCTHGLNLHGAYMAVIDSHLMDFKAWGPDSQAIYGNNGTGPYKIVNNHLEAAGENVMFGGDDAPIAQMVPSDIEIRNNHFFKPLKWKHTDPTYDGSLWTVKNLFELKNAQRTLVDGNTFENSWPRGADGAQQDFMFAITPRNQYGGNPWARVTDLTMTHNICLGNVAGVFNIAATDAQDHVHPSQLTERVLLQHNYFTVGYRVFQMASGWPQAPGATHVVIDHNTVDAETAYALLTFENDIMRCPHFVLTNNILPHGTYGVGSASGGPVGVIPTLNTCAPGALVRNNIIIRSPNPGDPYPLGNREAATLSDVGFVNVAAGNTLLAPTSMGYQGGYEGLNVGSETSRSSTPAIPPTPFPTQPGIDNTTRANESPLVNAGNPTNRGGPWTAVSNAQLLANQIRTITAADASFETTAGTTSADCEVYATVAAHPTTGFTWAMSLRSTAAGSYYLLLTGYAGSNVYGTVAIHRSVGGVDTAIAVRSNLSIPAGAQVGFSVVGFTLTGFVSGTAVLQVTDPLAAVPAAGKLGFYLNSAPSALTAVGGGPF